MMLVRKLVLSRCVIPSAPGEHEIKSRGPTSDAVDAGWINYSEIRVGASAVRVRWVPLR